MRSSSAYTQFQNRSYRVGAGGSIAAAKSPVSGPIAAARSRMAFSMSMLAMWLSIETPTSRGSRPMLM
jgi:hypothetical protein